MVLLVMLSCLTWNISAPDRMGSSLGQANNFSCRGIPDYLRCVGGSTHNCDYSYICLCGVFLHLLLAERCYKDNICDVIPKSNKAWLSSTGDTITWLQRDSHWLISWQCSFKIRLLACRGCAEHQSIDIIVHSYIANI